MKYSIRNRKANVFSAVFHLQRRETCSGHTMAITQRNQSPMQGETTVLTNHTLRTTMPTTALIHLSSNGSNVLLTSSKKLVCLFERFCLKKVELIIYKKKTGATFKIFRCKKRNKSCSYLLELSFQALVTTKKYKNPFSKIKVTKMVI